ncbi:hypothetical protein [Maridesulfovibrio ferrireducens]|uniref:hypothetical protein n=1 Tax=Maridesulfovibrio ferrireducens TaxID=246191 RepID=UPI001A23280E|nr:hypothetical protein [Maridesulfovibrio ferrireducens]MBI9112233.1 hypothetical protein [Maridesulfovibrio ferrireducens]
MSKYMWDWNTVLRIIAEIFAIVGLLIGIFVFWGKRKIESYFAKELKDHEAKLAKELQDTKYEIDTLFDKVSMVQKKEFEVLPIAWDNLYEAYRCMEVYLFSGIELYNFTDWNSSQVEKFLRDKQCSESAIAEILKSGNKGAKYVSMQEEIKKVNFHNSIYKFNDYINRNKIFMKADIQIAFVEAISFFTKVLSTLKKSDNFSDTGDSITDLNNFKNEVKAIMDKIEFLVQKKLQFEKAL